MTITRYILNINILDEIADLQNLLNYRRSIFTHANYGVLKLTP